MGEACADYR